MINRIGLFLLCIAVSGAVGPSVSHATPVLAAGSGTQLTPVAITVANVAGLTSFQFDLTFDPSILRVTGFGDTGSMGFPTDFETAALNQGGNLTGITGFVDNVSGFLSGVADSMSGISGSGLTPGGVIALIDFQGLRVGVSPVVLSNAFLIDNGVPLSSANGDFVLQQGSVEVLGTGVPEPSTLSLFVGALFVLLALARYCPKGRARTGA